MDYGAEASPLRPIYTQIRAIAALQQIEKLGSLWQFVLCDFACDLNARNWIVAKASRIVRPFALAFSGSREETITGTPELGLQKTRDAALHAPRDIGLTERSDITPTPRPLIREVRNRSPNSEWVQLVS